FHGRETELEHIVQNLMQESARIAILGSGGMGKTSLARAALHYPAVAGKYQYRFFVACDSATTDIELAELVGSHLGLKPAKNITKTVIQYLSRSPPCLLVLDNLETSWEEPESRAGVEEFLSLLTDMQHLALMITMRGAERPRKLRWTRPLLVPLQPLSDAAARQTFFDIADDIHEDQDITQLLELTDHMPLAVYLLAHLVDYEGAPNVLHRWKTEKTALLSAGHGKGSNLDASITISFSSPRMTSGAKELLSLLSILPDGLSDVELLQSKLAIGNVLTSNAVLLQTSLAYMDNMRLRALAPIREYMQHAHPPSLSQVQPLKNHFYSLLELYRKHVG
ncbi:P-loop containing nucleoside triphosphate hydrolase protein, partial [Mycena vulgaris]